MTQPAIAIAPDFSRHARHARRTTTPMTPAIKTMRTNFIGDQMLSLLDSLYTIQTRTIPDDCVCRWHQLGDRPWELLTTYATCPRHGWVDRTPHDIEAVLDWLMADWIIDPPAQLAADVKACRRAPGWLPAAAFGRLAERVIEHATPCWLWPIIQGVVATAKPATTAWPSSERAATALLPYPTIPTGRVLP